MHRFTAIFLVALLIALPPACGRFGDGSGEVTGTVCANPDDPEDCDENYDMHASYFTLEKVGERVLIRVRSTKGLDSDTDNLQFLIVDPDEVAGRLERPIALGPDNTIRPDIHLIRSYGFNCYPLIVDPESSQATITFETFGCDTGDEVKASFTIPLVGKEDREERGQLEGWFDFELRNPIPGNNSENRPY